MSTMRKALKILSFLALIGGIDLVLTLGVVATAPEEQLEILPTVLMVLSALFSFILGVLGIGAANRPSKAKTLLPIALVGLLVNAADVALAIMGGAVVVAPIINALITVAFAFTARQVYQESLR